MKNNEKENKTKNKRYYINSIISYSNNCYSNIWIFAKYNLLKKGDKKMIFKNQRLIENLKACINSLEDENNMIKQENKRLKTKNDILEHNIIIMIENAQENRKTIKNMDNNIDFLYNNLSRAKQKIAPRK